MKRLTKNRGFTLLELIIVMGMALILGAVLFRAMRDLFATNTFLSESLSNERDAEFVIQQMLREMRGVSTSDLGAYPLERVESTSISFFTNIDSDSSKERIQYFLQGTTLKKSVVKASANPATYATTSATESLSTVLKNVLATSTPLFSYFDKSYSGTTTPLVQPVSAIDVRHIRIQITIDKSPADTIPPANSIGEVTLRNLKDNY